MSKSEEEKRFWELKEAASRIEREALRCYRPGPIQAQAHQSGASELVVRGGNRCSAEGTLVWRMPKPTNTNGNNPWSTVNAVPVPIESLVAGDRVAGFRDGARKMSQCVAVVESVSEFTETGFRLRTKRGYETVATHDHPVWCCPPKPAGWNGGVDPDRTKACWRNVSDIPAGWYVRIGYGPYANATIESDDDAYFRGAMDGDGSIKSDSGVMRYTSHADEVDMRERLHSHLRSRGIGGAIKDYAKSDTLGVSTEWCSKSFKESYLASDFAQHPSPEQMKGYIQGLMDADGCATNDAKAVLIQKDLERLRRVHQWLLMFGVKASLYVTKPSLKHRRPNPIGRLQISGESYRQYCRAIGFRHEAKARKAAEHARGARPGQRSWWDRVASVEPTAPVRFIAIKTSTGTYLADGIYSHNSGKTIWGAAQLASLVTRQPIIGLDGKPITIQRPDRPLLTWVIGYDQKHIGQTLHRILFEPGAFLVIRDKKTAKWRTYRPWDEEDTSRQEEAKLAEPFIPERFIDSTAWISYGQKIFEAVYLKNGDKICAYPSTGEPKQGDPVDYIWVDEDVQHSRHIGEWQARLSDRKGRLVWTAFPHSRNNALVRMSERASTQADEFAAGKRAAKDVEEFVLKYRDNPFIDKDEKRKRLEGWDEEEARARDLGEFTYDTVLMYDWIPSVAGIPNVKGDTDELNVIWEQHRRFPDEWTRYLVLDPGHTTTAVLFAAIPPPKDFADKDYDDVIIIEDELYLAKATCEDTARKVAEKIAGRCYEKFIIDFRAGRQTPLGGSETIKQQYTAAFDRRGLRCRATGPGFMYASDNVESRRELLRTWLRPREEGGSKIRVVLDRCPNLQRELKTYRKRITSDKFIEDQPAKSPHDAIDCLEYLVAADPKWIPADQRVARGSAAFRFAQSLLKETAGMAGKFVHLGAGSS